MAGAHTQHEQLSARVGLAELYRAHIQLERDGLLKIKAALTQRLEVAERERAEFKRLSLEWHKLFQKRSDELTTAEAEIDVFKKELLWMQEQAKPYGGTFAMLDLCKMAESYRAILLKAGHTHCPPETWNGDLVEGYEQAMEDIKEWVRVQLTAHKALEHK